MPSSRRTPQRRRWKIRALVAALLLVAAALAGVYGYLANPTRAATAARGLLESIFNVTAKIDVAHFNLGGTIVLDGLQLNVKGGPEAGSRVLEARTVTIDHNPWSLLVGKFRATQMTLREPVVHVTENLQTGRFNYEMLFRPLTKGRPMRLPRIVVDRCTLRTGTLAAGKVEQLGQIEVSGGLYEMEAGCGVYVFNLAHGDGANAEGPTLSGRFDLGLGTFTARLVRFRFDGAQRHLLPPQLRAWWDQCKPSGDLSAVTVHYDPHADVRLKATVLMQEAQIDLPEVWPPGRLGRVEGRIEVENDRVEPDFRCRIDQQSPPLMADCHVKGWVRGMHEAASFDLQVTADGRMAKSTAPGEQMPAEEPAPILVRLANWFVKRFDPQATFSTSLRLARAAGEDVSVTGRMSLSGSGRYMPFPYPLRSAEAELVFEGRDLRIADLVGQGASDSTVRVRGTVGPLGPGPQVRLEVSAADVPLDEQLFDAIATRRPHIVPIIRMFVDEQMRRGLVSRLRRQMKDAGAEAGEAVATDVSAGSRRQQALSLLSSFRPGGTIRKLTARVNREAGVSSPVRIRTELDMAGVAILFRFWPYPWVATGGRLIIEQNRLTAEGLVGHGLVDKQATLTINGTLSRSPEGWSRPVPDVRIAVRGIPIDELLLLTLPEPHDELVRTVGLTGRGSADAHIFLNDEGRIDYRIETRMEGGEARLRDGELLISDLEGHVTVEPGRVDFHRIQGKTSASPIDATSPQPLPAAPAAPGAIALTGWADFSGAKPAFDLSVEARDVPVCESLLDVMPRNFHLGPKLRDVFKAYEPSGLLGAHLRSRTLEDGTADFKLTLTPKHLRLKMAGDTIDISRIEGGLTVQPKLLTLDGLRGSYGTGRFSLSGSVQLDEPFERRLKLGLVAESLDEPVRSILSAQALKAIDGLGLTGPFELENCELVERPSATTGTRRAFTGTVKLRDARASLGVTVTGLTATAALTILEPVAPGPSSVDLVLAAEQLRADGRLISPFSAHLHTDPDDPDRLAIRRIEGLCHEGTVEGDGHVDVSTGAYHFRLTLHDARLSGILSPIHDSGSSAVAAERNAGRLAAAVDVDGILGSAQSRRGRGRLRIRDAVMYKVPLTLGLLQVVNLALPTSSAFDSADIDYELEANRVRFDRLRFHSSGVEMVGRGTMLAPTKQLDLELFVRNPQGIDLGPMSQLLDKFKDELVSMRVTGTLETPIVEVETLRGIRRSWDSIFGAAGNPADDVTVTEAGSAASR